MELYEDEQGENNDREQEDDDDERLGEQIDKIIQHENANHRRKKQRVIPVRGIMGSASCLQFTDLH